MSRPHVTVVIPTRDRPQFLDQSLAAVLDQRDVDFEVVVVDDGSSSAPVPIGDSRVSVIRHERSQGVAAARNTGLARARGTWVAFCDDDDLWAPQKLATQLAALEAMPGAKWSCCGAAFVDDRLELIAEEPAPTSGDVAEAMLAMNAIPGGGSGVVADALVLRELGGFDPALSMLADWDLWLRLAVRGPVASVPETLLAYRMHGGAMSSQHARTNGELTYLERKHTTVRGRNGVGVPRPVLSFWMAERSQRGGRRMAAFGQYLRSAPTVGVRRALLRAAETLVWPGAYRLRDKRCRRLAADSWRGDVDAWIAPLRTRFFAGGPVVTAAAPGVPAAGIAVPPGG